MNKHNKNIQKFLIDKLNKYTDAEQIKILEVGIGSGRIGQLIADEVKEYKGIDLVEENVKKAKENIPENAKVEYKQGNAVDVPFEEEFDVILYINSLHFIKNHNKAISEVQRLLKSDGMVMIIEPTKYTTNWMSPKLRRDSEGFDEEIYNQKMKNIKDSEENIWKQEQLKIRRVFG